MVEEIIAKPFKKKFHNDIRITKLQFFCLKNKFIKPNSVATSGLHLLLFHIIELVYRLKSVVCNRKQEETLVLTC